MPPTRRAVFLDRDGVLNHSRFWRDQWRAPLDLDQLEIIAGVDQAVRDLRAAGFLLIGVTNQPDVARGWQTREKVDAINQAIAERLALDGLLACFHVSENDCECRKPRPGMLLEAATRWNIDLPRSVMVGDRHSDVEAGQRAGCATTFLVDSPAFESEPGGAEPTHRVPSLREAAQLILKL